MCECCNPEWSGNQDGWMDGCRTCIVNKPVDCRRSAFSVCVNVLLFTSHISRITLRCHSCTCQTYLCSHFICLYVLFSFKVASLCICEFLMQKKAKIQIVAQTNKSKEGEKRKISTLNLLLTVQSKRLSWRQIWLPQVSSE